MKSDPLDAVRNERAVLASIPESAIDFSDLHHLKVDEWKVQLPVGRNELYTAPPAEPAAEPMPSEQITDHIRGMDIDLREDLCPFSFRSGVRWAEKQHGIGGG